MLKQITVKFPSKCRKCGVSIPKFQRAYWRKGYGVFHHPSCPGSDKSNENSDSIGPAKKVGRQYDPSFSIDWPELRGILKDILFKGKFDLKGNFTQSHRKYIERNLLNHSSNSFGGFSSEALKRWLTDGYHTEAIKGLAGMVPPIREKKRLNYGEDGDEFHLDIAESGDENYMSYWTKREVIPGVKLSLELDASAGSSEALMSYQSWMAKAIYALESSGVDCEVEIFTLSRGLFSPQKGIARTAIKVKKEGEMADFLGFSAMLSPAAFRGIMFSVFTLQADRMNLQQRSYGSGVTDSWRVYYNDETKSIVSDCHWDSNSFPEERHTEQLRQAIQDMKKG